jgi:beta-galactosidase
VGPKELYVSQCEKLHASLRRRGINCDVVGRTSDWSGYRLLVVPALGPTGDELAERLAEWVAGGGTLIWHPLSGIKDEEGTIYPERLHPRLKELLGVAVKEFATVPPEEEIPFEWEGRRYAGRLFCDLPVLEGADALGEFVDRWWAGAPAVAQRWVDRGRALYVMTFADEEFYGDLFERVCAEAGLGRILDTALPPAVSVSERTGPDGARLVFLLNAGDEEETVALPEPMRDVYGDGALTGRVQLGPFGVAVLTPAGEGED